MNEFIGENLKNMRRDKGFSLLEVAEEIGVQYRTVNAWELGLKHVNDERLEQLAELYEVEVEDIECGVMR